MNTSRQIQIERLFQRVTALPVGERSAYLDANCDDAGIRTEVESLLRFDAVEDGGLSEGFARRHLPTQNMGPNAKVSRATSSPSGSAIDHGRFLPGTVFADRYRIVGLLGKGGMGEVYRADDLELGQSVALKFLPKALVDDQRALERFRGEVRLARQVSHPNVCRVYDIGQIDGQWFLSMEYVDGEDLAQLLRRIGRFPADRATELARQLCLGLHAAHEKGVLHRDLKPANIMVDGRGKLLITDFGLAALSDQINADDIRSGTPAYMSPEQLAGREVTEQSDIYSLGIILHEIYTGKPIWQADSMAELFEKRRSGTAPAPSSDVNELDPVVERVIKRCLESDPDNRPQNAISVTASLPGGDPLAAALAAGVTPSPDMVAASGQYTSLRPSIAIALLIGVIVGLVLVAWKAGSLRVISSDGEVKPPLALREIAMGIVRKDLGYNENEEVQDRAHGFANSLVPGETDLQFWYRERSEHNLNNLNVFDERGRDVIGRTTFQLPAWTVPGERGLRLTASGRLLFFRIIPPVGAAAGRKSVNPDELPWAQWFPEDSTGFILAPSDSELDNAVAENDASILTPVSDLVRTTPDDSDATRVWRGVDNRTSREVCVVAAAFRGRPVYFEVFPASEFEDNQPGASHFGMVTPLPNRNDRGQAVLVAFVNLILILAGFLAIYNINLRRVDRQGAFRVAVFVVCTMAVASMCMTHRLSLSRPVFPLLAMCVLNGALLWLIYVALEPFVRRTWPQMLVTWSRLVAGRISDPAVGQSLLVGVFAGVFVNLNGLVPYFVTATPESVSLLPLQSHAFTLSGTRELLAYLCFGQVQNVFVTAMMLLSLLLTRAVLRHERLAVLVNVILVTYLAMVSLRLPLDSGWRWYTVAVTIAVSYGILLRFGFLAAVVLVSMQNLIGQAPLTLDSDEWYYSHGLLVMAFAVAVAGYGCYTALGGRSFVRRLAV